MPAPYPLPQNLTGLGSVAQYIFSVDNNFFNLLLLALWILFYMLLTSSGRFSPAATFIVVSWSMFLIALFFSILGVINTQALFFLGIATAIGFIWVMNER